MSTEPGQAHSDLKAASELAGVCAFDTLEAALLWARVSNRQAEFVEFEGEYVCPAPDQPEAVVARYIRQEGAIKTEAEFQSRHHLPAF